MKKLVFQRRKGAAERGLCLDCGVNPQQSHGDGKYRPRCAQCQRAAFPPRSRHEPGKSRGGRKCAPRGVVVKGNLAYVTLTKGYTATIDAGDVALVADWNWSAHVVPSGRVCAMRRAQGQTVLMHRAIMAPPDDRYVDHINGDALDNRRANLRLATHAENIRNVQRRKKRALPTGVRYARQGKRFVAEIGYNGRHHYLGTFGSVEEAASARLRAEREFFGEFAPSNRPAA